MSLLSPTRAPFLLVDERRPTLVAHLTAFVIVMLAADLGRMFWVGSTEAALIWPPTGVALGLAIAYGPRILPSLAAGLLIWAIVLRGLEPWLWLMPAVALVLGPLTGYGVIRRLRAPARRRGPLRELLGFWLAGGLITVGVSSFIGAGNVAFHALFPEYGFATIWAAYWISEGFGTLVFAPLTIRALEACYSRRLLDQIELRWGHLMWVVALAGLVVLQVALANWVNPDYAAAVSYFYFPLLAVCAGLGSVTFTDAMTALVGTGIVTLTLVGGAGLGPPDTNFELLNTVLLVTAVTIMTQLLNAMAQTLRQRLAAERDAAQRDFLTGLANERALTNHLEANHDTGPSVLALLDVPAIRRALDLLGLEQADRIELRVAGTLAQRALTATTIARIGRGLYALLWYQTPRAAIEGSLDAAYEAIDGDRFHEGQVPLTLRPSAGALTLSTGRGDAGDLLAMASQTLRHAQESTGRRIVWYAPSAGLLEPARADQDRAEQVRVALTREDGFTVLAQPIVPLTRPDDTAPFHELLLRLPRGDSEAMGPGQFLGAAARHGLMPEIDRWIIDRGLALSARHGARVSINLSGASMADDSLLTWISQRCHTHGARPGDICFEITETESIHAFEAAARIVAGLRSQGYRIALDDFGTGLASFDYIRQLPLDFVKIDGSFVRAAMDSATDRAMVEAIRSVAATAHLATIAEFVEDEAIRSWLTSIGVDYGQGYAISRPVPVEAALGQGHIEPLPRTKASP